MANFRVGNLLEGHGNYHLLDIIGYVAADLWVRCRDTGREGGVVSWQAEKTNKDDNLAWVLG